MLIRLVSPGSRASTLAHDDRSYTHFETKDEIVAAVVAETVAGLADAIGDVVERLDDPDEAMSVGARRLIELCRTDPELPRLLVRLDDGERPSSS
jgi:AcrR family transcriptional regulator